MNYLIVHNGRSGPRLLQLARGTMVERGGVSSSVRGWPFTSASSVGEAARRFGAGTYDGSGLFANQDALVLRLVAEGRESDRDRRASKAKLVSAHPALKDSSSTAGAPRVVRTATRSPRESPPDHELMWTAGDQEDGGGPETILRELTHERRHLFQSAGLFERMSWKLA